MRGAQEVIERLSAKQRCTWYTVIVEQKEVLITVLFSVLVLGFSQKQAPKQGFECKQFIWKVKGSISRE